MAGGEGVSTEGPGNGVDPVTGDQGDEEELNSGERISEVGYRPAYSFTWG